MTRSDFLPVNKNDMIERGWDSVDFVYVIGDAYVDHPSFGHAIISRVLEAHGYRIGIISQPDWKDPRSIQVFGEPRLGFLVSEAIWTLWSTTTAYQKSTEKRMPTLPEARWEKDRIMHVLSTVI